MKKILLFSMMLFAFLSANAATGVTYSVTVPAGTKACYIAGEMTGTSWPQVEMTKVDATHYTITIAGATTLQKYKYCSGPGWAYEENIAANRTYSASDVVASWKLVYDPAVVPVSVTYDVTVPATDKCYINGNATSWAFTEMTKISNTHFTITLSIIPATKDGYKYSAGPAWTFEELTAGGGAVANRTYSANDVVAQWKSIPTSLESVADNSVIVAALNGEITAKFEGIAKVDVYTITGVLVTSSTVEGEFSQLVSAGAYVVVVNGKATKVLVK